MSAAEADFLLVGAFAIAVHQYPRATGDIDLWVRPELANARRVWNALANFGAPVEDLTVEELSRPGFFYQVGVAPVRIDILTAIDGVSFDEAWAEKEDHDLFGVAVPVISRRHLLINKKATGRPKDQADAAWLEESQSD
ncbi:MAG TPA: hypothetical protein VFJ82_12855 [Longimicrobium sp.]|nr:hypothetical protein [Longimicrobium sp.]